MEFWNCGKGQPTELERTTSQPLVSARSQKGTVKHVLLAKKPPKQDADAEVGQQKMCQVFKGGQAEE